MRILRIGAALAFAAQYVFALALAPALTAHVAMTDGTKLVTDVYLPQPEGGRWPVILVRSTYGRGTEFAEPYVTQGYAVAVQDVRGRGESEGEHYVFNSDGWRPGLTDGADTVAWVRAQPWSNGAIGTWGGSALGITQMLLAPVTPRVAAQFIEIAPSNLYEDMAYPGGVFRKSLLEGWLADIQQPHIVAVYKGHSQYDGYWAYYNVEAKARDITAPALFVGGWYDIFQQGTIDAFVTRERNGGPGAKGGNYLIMKFCSHLETPWPDYKPNENRYALDVNEALGKFYARTLKGDVHALDGFAKVHYYAIGADTPGAPGNEWRTADAWPPFAVNATSYYLRDGGSLSVAKPTGPGTTSASFTFDPKNPFPTRGGNNLLLPAGPYDQRAAGSGRRDMIHYATAPLAGPAEITGRVTARLFISSDAPDTDFTAKLLDIYPAGDDRQILVLDGIRRVKTRLGYDTVAPPLNGPNEIVAIEIDLQSTSWIFDTGHRIGLDISSSNYPRFEVNPNTGADFPVTGSEMRVANNTVYTDEIHHSALLLPILPSKASE